MPAKQNKMGKRKSTTNESENIQKSSEEICVPNFSKKAKKVKMANKTKEKVPEHEESTSAVIPESFHNEPHTDGTGDVQRQGPNLDNCDTPSKSGDSDAKIDAPTFTDNKDEQEIGDKGDGANIGSVLKTKESIECKESSEDAVKKDVELEGKPCSPIRPVTTAEDAVLPNTKEKTSLHEDVSLGNLLDGDQEIAYAIKSHSKSIMDTTIDGLLQTNIAEESHQTNTAIEKVLTDTAEVTPSKEPYEVIRSSSSIEVTVKETYQGEIQMMPLEADGKEDIETLSKDNSSIVGPIAVHGGEVAAISDVNEATENAVSNLIEDILPKSAIIDMEVTSESNVVDTSAPSSTTKLHGSSGNADYTLLMSKQVIDSPTITEDKPRDTRQFIIQDGRKIYAIKGGIDTMDSPTITEDKPRDTRQVIIQDGRKIYAIEGGIDTMDSPTITVDKPRDNREFIIQDGRKIYAIEGGIDTMDSPTITVDKPRDTRQFIIQDGRKIYAIEGGIDTAENLLHAYQQEKRSPAAITVNKGRDTRPFFMHDGRKIYAIEGGIDTMDSPTITDDKPRDTRQFIIQDGKKIYAIEGGIETRVNLSCAYQKVSGSDLERSPVTNCIKINKSTEPTAPESEISNELLALDNDINISMDVVNLSRPMVTEKDIVKLDVISEKHTAEPHRQSGSLSQMFEPDCNDEKSSSSHKITEVHSSMFQSDKDFNTPRPWNNFSCSKKEILFLNEVNKTEADYIVNTFNIKDTIKSPVISAQMMKTPTSAEFDDIGLSDSQLCAMEWQQPASNIRSSNTSQFVDRKSRPKPSEPKDGTSIVRAIVLEMASLNKMILKTKREVEAMRKKVQQPTTHLPHQRNAVRKSNI